MQPSCPKGTNLPPSSSPLHPWCNVVLATAQVYISSVTVRKQHCNSRGGKRSFSLICDCKHFCQGKCKKNSYFCNVSQHVLSEVVRLHLLGFCFISWISTIHRETIYGFSKTNTWILRSFDFNSVLTRQTSEKVAFKNVCPNHQRFAWKNSKISVTGGAAAPLAPPARTPMAVLSSSHCENLNGAYYIKEGFCEVSLNEARLCTSTWQTSCVQCMSENSPQISRWS